MLDDQSRRNHLVSDEQQQSTQEENEIQLHPVQKWSGLAREYIRLSINSTLSDEQVERLDCILVIAEREPWLNFLIQEIDYEVGKRLGLLSNDQIETYLDQQAKLSEFHGECFGILNIAGLKN